MSKQRCPLTPIERRPSRRLLAAAAVALGLLPLSAAPGSGLAEPELVHLVILHTNDIHGQALPRELTAPDGARRAVGGLERVAEAIEQVRATHVGRDRGLLVVDGGDWWQGTPEGSLDGALPFLSTLAEVGYDAMAVGNHEFDLGLAPLRRMLDESGLPAVCANVRTAADGERVDWLTPWRIVEVAGLEVAIVGLIYEQTPFITHAESRTLHFADEVAELRRVLSELPEGVDLVLPLTHCGVEVDRELAEAFPELPLIVGGHSHTFLPGGLEVGGTLVCQAGSKTQALGRVDLLVDAATGAVVDKSSRLIELDGPLPERRRNPAIAERVETLAAAGEAALGEVLGELAGPLVEPGPWSSGSVGNWIADAFRRGVDADVALHNRGGIRARLGPGPLSRRDLFQLLPFQNSLVAFELTGAELERCLRGGILGREAAKLEVSGLSLEVTLDDEGRAVALGIEIGGAPLDREARYRVATNSYLAGGGDRLFELDRELEVLDTGLLLRELLERDLRESAGPFAAPGRDHYEERRAR